MSPGRADAHRLDELLQATRLSIAPDTVRVELNLTPGVAVAAGVTAGLGPDHVLQALHVESDGRPVLLRLERWSVPADDALREGTGTFRLVAAGSLARESGRHRLAFANDFQPGISAYLVNALAPEDRRVQLGLPRRDTMQRTFAIEYDVATPWLPWLAIGAGMIAVLLARNARGRRRSRRLGVPSHLVRPEAPPLT